MCDYSTMPLGMRIRRALVIIGGLSLVVCIAFLDVQMQYRNSVVLDKKETVDWNASAKHRTLMQRLSRKDRRIKNLDYPSFSDTEIGRLLEDDNR